MGRTLLNGVDGVLSGSIGRSLLNTQTTGYAVVAKLVQGANVTFSQTGIDTGTGDVTINVSTFPAASLTGATLPAGITASSLTSVGTLGSLSVAGLAGAAASYINTGNGSYFGFNLYNNSGWKYAATDYGYVICHDGADVSINGAPSGTAGATATPVTLMTLNQSGVISIPGSLGVTGTASASGHISTVSSGVALQMGPGSAIRDVTNGASTMFFDVSVGGGTVGSYSWRTTSSYSTIMSLTSSALAVSGQVNAGACCFGYMAEDSNLSYGVAFSGWNCVRSTVGSANSWLFSSDGVNNAGTVAVQSIYGGLTFYVAPVASGGSAQTLTSTQLATHAVLGVSATGVSALQTTVSSSATTGALTVAGGLGVNASSYFGSSTAASAAPTSINMDTSYSTTAGQHLKFNVGFGSYGLGLSAGQLDVVSGGTIGFWSGKTSIASLSAAGVLTLPAAPVLTALSGLVLGQGATAAKAVTIQSQTIAVTAANTLAAIPTTPQGLFFLLLVNGQAFLPVGASPPFTVSGTTITWSAANAGIALATGDLVQLLYI
jgi:hypothetical protein